MSDDDGADAADTAGSEGPEARERRFGGCGDFLFDFFFGGDGWFGDCGRGGRGGGRHC